LKAEHALFAVARLETFNRDPKPAKTLALAEATGFFYKNEAGKVFLITNEHVVYSEPQRYFPNTIKIWVHTDLYHLKKTKSIELPLWETKERRFRKLWKRARYRPIDIAAVEIPNEELKGCVYFFFSKDDLLDKGEDLLPGKDIELGLQALILGYPLGFYDENNHLPIARAATVATWPWLSFEGKPYFLVDAVTHPGLSGSPVISSVVAYDTTGSDDPTSDKRTSKSYLLGIFSAEKTPYNIPLGLNMVWHATVIRDIVEAE